MIVTSCHVRVAIPVAVRNPEETADRFPGGWRTYLREITAETSKDILIEISEEFEKEFHEDFPKEF